MNRYGMGAATAIAAALATHGHIASQGVLAWALYGLAVLCFIG